MFSYMFCYPFLVAGQPATAWTESALLPGFVHTGVLELGPLVYKLSMTAVNSSGP